MERKNQNIKTVIVNRGHYLWAASRRVVIRDLIKRIQDLQRLPLSLLENMRGRSRIKYGMTTLFNNVAFTLIELLIVVLIIGILAAVAVPQYKKAVNVSRIKSLLPMARSVLESERRFFLENGYYTGNLKRLDITPAQNCNENGYRCYYGEVRIQGSLSDDLNGGGLIVSQPQTPHIYIWPNANTLCCRANDTADNENHKSCKQAMQPLSGSTPINGATYYCIKV